MDVNYQFNRAGSLSSPLNERIPSKRGLASAEDYAVCRQIMRQASQNYSAASNYLPPEVLPHIEALYALMRVGDDRVDVSHTGFSSPLAAINDWEQAYWLAFEHGDSPHPVLRAYLDTAQRFGIPAHTMSAYFEAMRADLTVTRFPTFDHLREYMQGSAIPVGRAMTHILGVRRPYNLAEALPGADALSIAMQLSNFWRDIGEDWQRGRIYLPLEDMETFRVTEADLAQSRVSRRLVVLLEYEFERTESCYTQARASVPMLASGRWAVMSALEIYRYILADLRAHRYNVFTYRAGASQLQKLRLGLQAYWPSR